MPEPNLTLIPIPTTGRALVLRAVDHLESAVAAVAAEIALAAPGSVHRARALTAIAREALAIVDDALSVAAGSAPVPDMDPEDAAKGTGRFRRPEPGDDTEPGASW